MTQLSLSSPPNLNTHHYWQGNLPVAFVFSVPGAREKSANRPIAGATGENLSLALNYLHIELPAIFSSLDRYAYRITNAHSKPIAKSLGDASSQASNAQVKTSGNISRVLRDLDGCNIVILCGIKAQLLRESIQRPGRTIVNSWHISNQGLSSKFRSHDISAVVDSHARRQQRVNLWAQELISSFSFVPHVA